jgi:hypothetical protein
LISQNRELLADAAAVELSRNPLALARILYKAQVANSYLGDSSFFAPIFLSRLIPRKSLIPPGASFLTPIPR